MKLKPSELDCFLLEKIWHQSIIRRPLQLDEKEKFSILINSLIFLRTINFKKKENHWMSTESIKNF